MDASGDDAVRPDGASDEKWEECEASWARSKSGLRIDLFNRRFDDAEERDRVYDALEDPQEPRSIFWCVDSKLLSLTHAFSLVIVEVEWEEAGDVQCVEEQRCGFAESKSALFAVNLLELFALVGLVTLPGHAFGCNAL